MKSEVVAIVGASEKPDRYAYKAMKMLIEHGHEVLLVNPKLLKINEFTVYSALSDLKGPVDTVTMYVGPAVSDGLVREIIKLRPGRVIFNPGSENDGLEKELTRAGIKSERACTLVLLTTGQF